MRCVGQRQLHADRTRRAACAEDNDALAFDVNAVGLQRHHEALAVCVVAIQAAVGIDDGVDRADELRALRDLVQILHDGDLVRDRAVDAAHLERLQAVDGVFQLILIHIQRQKVPAFQSQCRKCGVLNDHAGVLRDRLAEDADKVVKIILFLHARAPFCCVIRFRMT